MLGFFIGVACGAAELFLLQRLINVMLGGQSFRVVLLILLKLAVLVATLAVVTIFMRQDLVWCGVGIAGFLIGGSVVLFMKNAEMKGGNKN